MKCGECLFHFRIPQPKEELFNCTQILDIDGDIDGFTGVGDHKLVVSKEPALDRNRIESFPVRHVSAEFEVGDGLPVLQPATTVQGLV